MILYHGSNVEIQHIDLSKSARGKDFGKGFYLSENEGKPKKWLSSNHCRQIVHPS